MELFSLIKGAGWHPFCLCGALEGVWRYDWEWVVILVLRPTVHTFPSGLFWQATASANLCECIHICLQANKCSSFCTLSNAPILYQSYRLPSNTCILSELLHPLPPILYHSHRLPSQTYACTVSICAFACFPQPPILNLLHRFPSNTYACCMHRSSSTTWAWELPPHSPTLLPSLLPNPHTTHKQPTQPPSSRNKPRLLIYPKLPSCTWPWYCHSSDRNFTPPPCAAYSKQGTQHDWWVRRDLPSKICLMSLIREAWYDARASLQFCSWVHTYTYILTHIHTHGRTKADIGAPLPVSMSSACST